MTKESEAARHSPLRTSTSREKAWRGPNTSHLLGGRGQRLDGDLDVDFLADVKLAGRQHLVPGEAESVAQNGGAGGEDQSIVTPRISHFSAVFRGHANLARNAANGERAGHLKSPRPDCFDARAGERDGRMALGVEEIRRPKVRVAPRIVGIHAV